MRNLDDGREQFFSVSSFKATFVWRCGSKSVDVPLTWEDFVAYSTQHRCGGFFLCQFWSHEPMGILAGQSNMWPAVLLAITMLSIVLFVALRLWWRSMQRRGPEFWHMSKLPLEKCIHVDAVSTVETSILCWKVGFQRLWFREKNQLFARHSGDGDENAEVDLVIKEVAHVQLCQSSIEFSASAGGTPSSARRPTWWTAPSTFGWGWKHPYGVSWRFCAWTMSKKTQLGFPAKKNNSIDCGRKIDSDLGWCFDLIVW